MLKNVLIGAAGVLVSALLVYLMVQSSAVDSEYYVDYGNRVNLLRQAQTDFNAMSEALHSAYREGRAVSGSALATLERLEDGHGELVAMIRESGDSDAVGSVAPYSAAVSTTVAAAREFAAQQRKLTDSLNLVRTESPALVRDLRRFNLQALSQAVFAVAVDVVDYVGGGAAHKRSVLLSRLDELENNRDAQSKVPGKLDTLIAASRTVVTTRGEAGASLEQIASSALPGTRAELATALRGHNRVVVGRADRARTLLALFSLLFLAGIAYTAFKLRSSYSDLSESKGALVQLNQSLEDRVNARTEQLSNAYVDLKESQSQLVHAEKMSSLGELVAGISHEINTPLWYLLSNSTMLQERLQTVQDFVGVVEELLEQVRNGENDKQKFVALLRELNHRLTSDGLHDDLDEAADLTRDSIEGLEQLAEMAQSLKDFSRLDRAAVDRFNVNDGLEKSLLIAKNFLKNRVTVNKNFGDVAPIMCAPSQINQIFLNLIKNASDAIGNDGNIDITTTQQGDNVIVRIRDTGSGIPPEVMDKIRDPFFTTKEVGKGTGLGLSIVDKIINSHFGKLEIESTPGEGSLFTVTLPIDKRPQDDDASDLESQLDALDGAPLAQAAG